MTQLLASFELQLHRTKFNSSESPTTVTLCKWTANIQDTHHRGTEQICRSVDEIASSAISKTGYVYVLLRPFMFREMETTC